jgi:electron transfer flavoprotein alpha subunit
MRNVIEQGDELVNSNGLRILVPIKQVPRTEEIALDEAGRLIRHGVDLEINAFCRRAITKAVDIAHERGGTVTAVTMGPLQAAAAIREAIAAGADEGYLLSDPGLAGSDTLVTAQVLARFVAEFGPFSMIMLGRFSIDAGTGQVGPQLAELLGLPYAGAANSIEYGDEFVTLHCELDSGTREVVVQLPAVIAVAERLCAPSKPSPASIESVELDRVTVLDADRLGIDFPVGIDGSPTFVRGMTRVQQARCGLGWPGSLEEQVAKLAVFLEGRDFGGDVEPSAGSVLDSSVFLTSIVVVCDHEQRPATEELIAFANQLCRSDQARLTLIGFDDGKGHFSGGDCTVELRGSKHEADVAAVLAEWISDNPPELIIAPATGFGREVAARLAAVLRVGLIGDALDLEVIDGGKVVAYKPVGSELTMAAISTRSSIQIVTMKPGRVTRTDRSQTSRASSEQVLTVPRRVNIETISRDVTEDVRELDEARFVIGVGLGVDPTDYPFVYEQAARIGASVACTRKVADRGWMPRSRQIGVTGRSIAPALYLALGTRGSFNHLVGVNGAGTIIGVNNDPAAASSSAIDAVVLSDWKAALPRIIDLVAELLGLEVVSRCI